MKKHAVFCIIVILTAWSLLLVNPAAASTTTPIVPEFTIRAVAYPYDVPPTTTSTTDPYTGKVTTTTVPGYHVENKTVEAVIKNNGAINYNFRYKGHYTDKWSYEPFTPSNYNVWDGFSVPYQATASEYTVVKLWFLPYSPADGLVDVQVQGLFGTYDAIPYGHVAFVGGPTYDFVFKGEASDWSNIITLKIGTNDTTTSPNTAPSQSNSQPDSGTPPSQNPITPPTDQSANQSTIQSLNQTAVQSDKQIDQTGNQPPSEILYEIAVGAIFVFGAGLGLLVYFRKHKNPTELTVSLVKSIFLFTKRLKLVKIPRSLL